MSRRIGVVTTSRADYGYLRPILKQLAADAAFSVDLFAGGMHLLPEYGETITDIARDNWPSVVRVNLPVEATSPEKMATSMGEGVAAMGHALGEHKQDILVVLGDRFEMYAAALAALPAGIALAHIHGGEVTTGAMDDLFRHSLTKLANLHFVSTEPYARRVIQMGEEPWRVTVSGAPALDSFLAEDPMQLREAERLAGVSLSTPFVLFTLHPETRGARSQTDMARTVLRALDNIDLPVIMTGTNADPGSAEIAAAMKEFRAANRNVHFVESFGARAFRTALAHAAVMVGNSSSGILEAASFALPVVNVGSRQEGRIRAANVIDVPLETSQIAAAIVLARSTAFRSKLAGMTNPYGDGHAAERIVSVLRDVPLDDRLMIKKFHDMRVP